MVDSYVSRQAVTGIFMSVIRDYLTRKTENEEGMKLTNQAAHFSAGE